MVARAYRDPRGSLSCCQKLHYSACRKISKLFVLADATCGDPGHSRNGMPSLRHILVSADIVWVDWSSHGKCKCQSRSRPKWPGQKWLQVIFKLGTLWLCTAVRICFPVHDTMFCWLCMLWQDCSPLRPGAVFISTQWWTWWVADFDWSPTLPYVTVLVLATATDLGAVQLQFGCQQFTLPAPEPTVLYTANTIRLELNTWARTCERTLRG